MGSTHNIVINEDTGYGYAVGTRTCSGGLHIIDLKTNPARPAYVGCYAADGYTHDAQCLVYDGDDDTYEGHEICFNYNEDTLTIVDVSNKDKIVEISRTPYDFVQYSHQGWVTEDHNYLLLDDELDEDKYDGKSGNFPCLDSSNNAHTRTLIWDISDLAKPVHTADYCSPAVAIDHNLYIKGDYAYESNYESGLRVLDVSDIGEDTPTLNEIAFFDTFPERNSVQFNGAWSVFPLFEFDDASDAYVIVQDINRGLFILSDPAPADHISPKRKLKKAKEAQRRLAKAHQ